jgi:hypothetical protein
MYGCLGASRAATKVSLGSSVRWPLIVTLTIIRSLSSVESRQKIPRDGEENALYGPRKRASTPQADHKHGRAAHSLGSL